MTQRAAFQVQVLEKLGAPLMAAVSEVAARQNPEISDAKEEAARVAELLGKTVQVSIGLAGSMALRETDAQKADAVRLALAALASPLVAGQYRLTGKVPGDAEIKRVIKALEAVLIFSDNFAPAAENTARLEALQAETLPADENQISIQYVAALVPAVNAVGAFPFGRAETKLVQEVAEKLVSRAEALGKALSNGADDKTAKRASLRLLQALSLIYAECHRQETARLLALGEQERAKLAETSGGLLPLDPVWAAFELRAGMAEIIAKTAAPSGVAVSSGGSKAPVFTAPAAPPAAPPSAPPAAKEEGGGSASYNPMSFFKPKEDGSKEGGA